MLIDVCNVTQTVIVEFPDDRTIDSYLKENGLYLWTTYLYLRSQHKDSLITQVENVVAYRLKTQLNVSSETQQSFREHDNLSRNTTAFSRTLKSFPGQQSFSKHHNFFLEHNNLGRNTTVLVVTQQSIAVTCNKEKEFRNKWKIFFCPYNIL